jgi:hypothetical protein
MMSKMKDEEFIKEKEANLRYQTVQLEEDKLGEILLENKYKIKESNSQFWRNMDMGIYPYSKPIKNK